MQKLLTAYKRYEKYLRRILGVLVKFPAALPLMLTRRYRSQFAGGWLISETGDQARDNGYHLHAYIRENHPEIRLTYVIPENAPDRRKLGKYASTVAPDSLEHVAAFIGAEKLISSHSFGAFPYGKASRPMLRFLPPKDTVWLQHGILIAALKPWVSPHGLIVASSPGEIPRLSAGNPQIEANTQVLGLARYDALVDRSHEEEQKIILVMPSHRKWFDHYWGLPTAMEFFKSDPYHQNWQRFLNDPRLQQLCEQQNCRVIFYPHQFVQRYISAFDSPGQHVTIAHADQYDVQDLLTRSSMLVTDYSSVLFDTAYMKKPAAYFQFDQDRYENEHYALGEWRYDTDGFGPVTDTVEELIGVVTETVDSGFEMPAKYQQRRTDFYQFFDQDNRKRNFEAIANL